MLLNELFEAELETITGEDLWDEVSGDAKNYKPTRIFMVKDDGKSPKLDVFTDKNGRLVKMVTMARAEFVKSFERIRSSDTPDAEGYLQFRAADTVEAAKYTGEPRRVELDGTTVTIKSGDFLVRSIDGKSFSFSVATADDFKSFKAA